ncbi:MAG TPA: chemotaxis protein CheB [Thermoanaerobaculia bacterium]|nr:chemotaxis protein CheB [Thermoanaerobaculia bacterium]
MSDGGGPVRLLVADDSGSVRAVLRRFFSWTDDVEVVGEAPDGEAAIRLVEELAPQVVLMDLMMPGLDGYRAIEQIMARRPTPIVVLTSKAARDQVRTAFEALRRGAVEVLPKPEDPASWRHLAKVLPEVVRAVAASQPVPARGAPRRARRRPPATATGEEATSGPRRELRWLAIGASTGGPSALADLLAALPPRPPLSVLVVQHISPGFEGGLVDWLAGEVGLDVRLARDGETPPLSAVRVAPPGVHLQVADGRLHLDCETPPWRGHRPSVDELFFSLARGGGAAARVAAVLLSGMGSDGVQGMGELARGGALTLVQDEATSVLYGMPRAAWEMGVAAKALPPAGIAREVAACWRSAPSSEPSPKQRPREPRSR